MLPGKIAEQFAALVGRIAEVERKQAGMMRHGTVAEVDPEAGTIRLKLGTSDAGGDFLSPSIPYSQMAGALKAHIPPSVGQQFTLIAPSGDWRQAVAVPMTWSNDNASPSSSGDENVLTYGDVKLLLDAGTVRAEIGGMTFELTEDAATVSVGGVTFEVSGGGVAITGGSVTHNGTDIGDTHIHGGVMSGPATTSVPK